MKNDSTVTVLNIFFHAWVGYSILGNTLDSVLVVHWSQAGHFVGHSGYSTIPYKIFSLKSAFTKKTRGSCCPSFKIPYWKISEESQKKYYSLWKADFQKIG